ncbi:MAG TPA: alpha-L-arabinofuranosidase C-terminal domain-containing protein [Acidothermaceae bacterium]
MNLGTRGVQEALDLLEYCNVSGGSKLSDLRRRNGAPELYGIRTWCLGNEMDGPWQIGHRSAAQYGNLAAQTGRAMRLLDPKLTLIPCGSSGPDMPTFGAWEATVLQETYDVVDLISAHAYFREEDGDLASFLACPVRMDEFIDGVVATVDSVKASLKQTKRIDIAFDEWNVWYQQAESSQATSDSWPFAPHLFEQDYNVADAVVVGGLLIALMRHSDRVASANLAQLVNVIAPIMTEEHGRAWRQTTFYPFAQAAKMASGSVLMGKMVAPIVESAKWGDVPMLDAVATHDPERGEMALFIVNRSIDREVSLRVQTYGALPDHIATATVLCDDDPRRTAQAGSASILRSNHSAVRRDQGLEIVLPPVSWNVVKLVTDEV